MESENPLPEERKKWCEEAWKLIQLAEIDGIFSDELSPDEVYRTTSTPLDTVPIPTVDTDSGITQRDVDAALRRLT